MKNNQFLLHPDVIIFLVVGPSGVGKTTLVQKLLVSRRFRGSLKFLVSHTNRLQREGEQDDVHYHFVTDQQFQDMKDANAFAEWNEVYPEKSYATSYDEIARVVASGSHGITDIDVDGAIALKIQFPKNIHTIFLQPQSDDQARIQLEKRSVTDGVVGKELVDRIRRFDYEIRMKDAFDSLITSVADHPELACRYASEIISDKVHAYQGTGAFVY